MEEKSQGFKEKIRLLEDSLVNGLDLQVKDATGLDVMGKYLKVEKVVVGKEKLVEVRLKI